MPGSARHWTDTDSPVERDPCLQVACFAQPMGCAHAARACCCCFGWASLAMLLSPLWQCLFVAVGAPVESWGLVCECFAEAAQQVRSTPPASSNLSLPVNTIYANALLGKVTSGLRIGAGGAAGGPADVQ